MTTSTITRSTEARRLGRTSLLAAGLLAAGVGGELLVGVQAPDGEIQRPVLFAAFVAAFVAGSLLLALVFHGLAVLHRAAGTPLPRSGRAGVRSGVAGSGLLALSGVLVGATGLRSGAPAEWSFLPLAAGLLLQFVGAILLGLGQRRAGLLGTAAGLPWLAALGSLVAVGVGVDPWHDLGLFVSYAAWAALGFTLIHRGGTLEG